MKRQMQTREEANDRRQSDGVLLVRSEMALSRFARESAAFVGFVCMRACVFLFVFALLLCKGVLVLVLMLFFRF